MKDYIPRINAIKKEFIALQNEDFKPAIDGTHHKVFLSTRYVIRFRDDNPKLLLRETNILEQLNHPLIPKVLWLGKVDTSIAMVENRLSGTAIHHVWKTLKRVDQKNIIRQVIEFIQYLRTQTRDHIYSVNTGKRYKTFFDYLVDGVEQKVSAIRKFDYTEKIIGDILEIIEKPETTDPPFFNKGEIIFNHGDLIIHNLLTDGKNLTGVLDWELGLFGDPDYDLFRLLYYQECAKAYQKQGIDETFESHYMDALMEGIRKSDLMGDERLFQKKYHFVRSIFYLNAMYWAVNSDDPRKYINEVIKNWNEDYFDNKKFFCV